MPYSIKKHPSCPKNKPFAVIKTASGAKVACHRSRALAERQIRAINASEHAGKEKGDVSETKDQVEEEEEVEDKSIYWGLGITSFAEYDARDEAMQRSVDMDDLNWKFRSIVDGILATEEISDKMDAIERAIGEYRQRMENVLSHENKSILDRVKDAMSSDNEEKATYKRENGIDFPSADYAYVPDKSKATTWRLRMTEAPNKLSLKRLRAIAKALSPASDVKAGIPKSSATSVKRRVRRAFRKLGVAENEIPVSVKATDFNPIYLWKDQNGEYKFCAIYSNNFIDDDNPPDILSEKAHLGFIGAVEKGIFDYPDLLHWHIPETRWGKASKLMYVDGFIIALGEIDKGHEKEAAAIAASEQTLAMSHGMPRPLIVRNDKDPRVIDFYVSTEISVLPLDKAANKYTGFVIFNRKEQESMALTQDQVDYLREHKVDPSVVESLSGLKDIADDIEDIGRERKDVTGEESTDELPPKDEEKTEDDSEDTPVYATREETGKAIGETIAPLIEALKFVGERLATVEASLKEVTVANSEAIDRAAEVTPAASLKELIAQSIVGESDALIDGRKSLAKSGPREAEESTEVIEGLDSPFLTDLIKGSYSDGG